MTERKFYKTSISFEVLTEAPLDESLSLADIEYEFSEGHASAGQVVYKETVLNGVEAAKALQAQGSEPEFFQLDENGDDVE